MDHDDELKGTIYSRREAIQKATTAGLAALIGGAGGSALAQVGQGDTKLIGRNFLVASPELTQGPFFNDEKLYRSDITQGTTRPSILTALPLVLKIHVWEINGNYGRPLSNATVDVWHCCGIGVYSGEQNGGNGENTLGQKWLRGYQVTGKSGLVQFKTIWPGWYPGRTIHIHFKIRVPDGNQTYDFTSQLFMDDAINDIIMSQPPYNSRGNRTTRNLNDNIYRTPQADGSMAGTHLTLTVTDNPKGGKIGEFHVGFDMD